MIRFSHCDPLQEYRWCDLPEDMQHHAEAVWVYGGRDISLTQQLLTPHWKICAGIERYWDADREKVISCNSILLGPVKTPRRNRNPSGYELIAVRLNPEAAAAAIGIAPVDLLDRDVRSVGLAVFDRALGLAAQGEPAALVSSALLGSLLTYRPRRRRAVDRFAAEIRKAKGQVNLGDLASDVGVSLRSVRRFFDAELGISPKTYCRSVRLKSLLLYADRIEKPRWSDLALRFGYSDQSHMCQDFQALTGSTPSRLHRYRRTG